MIILSVTIARTLQFHYSVLDDFRDKLNSTRNIRTKQKVARFVCGKLVRKYRLLRMAKANLSVETRSWKWDSEGKPSDYVRSVRVNPRVYICRDFFSRDDNSRLAAGKKNTITRKKVKKQRRILCIKET